MKYNQGKNTFYRIIAFRDGVVCVDIGAEILGPFKDGVEKVLGTEVICRLFL